jgi:hypothetical protein
MIMFFQLSKAGDKKKEKNVNMGLNLPGLKRE